MTRSILQRIAAGDPAAVSECIGEHGALVWSLARRFSQTPSDAEDATQEIFFEIWRYAGRYDRALGCEKTFIAIIARRRLIDRWRKAAAEPSMYSSVEEVESLVWAEPRNTLEVCDEAEQAMKAVARLRPEYRLVLELGFLQCLSQTQIAQRLGLPLGTVKTYMRRGLMNIRECFDNDITSLASKPRRNRSRALKPFAINSHRLDGPAVPISERPRTPFRPHRIAHFEFQPSHADRLGVNEVAGVEQEPFAAPCLA